MFLPVDIAWFYLLLVQSEGAYDIRPHCRTESQRLVGDWLTSTQTQGKTEIGMGWRAVGRGVALLWNSFQFEIAKLQWSKGHRTACWEISWGVRATWKSKSVVCLCLLLRSGPADPGLTLTDTVFFTALGLWATLPTLLNMIYLSDIH